MNNQHPPKRPSKQSPRRPPEAPAKGPTGERLQKVLAQMGLGSRREIEGWITAGEVRVNGQPAQLGDRVSVGDRVRVRGQDVRLDLRASSPPRRVIAYNKPEGEVVTRRDPEGRPTVFAALPRPRQGRWVAVGRLDVNTSGLLLFTTDGELAHRLMHPSQSVEREYAVRVLGEVSEVTLRQLVQGLELEDGPARFESVTPAGGEGANRWYQVVLKEGRKREVRRLWEAAGVRVSRLIRIRYGDINLGPRVFAGHWRELEPAELQALLALAGLEDASTPRPQSWRRDRSAAPRPGAAARSPRRR